MKVNGNKGEGMEKGLLTKIKEIYKNKQNIIEYLKNKDNRTQNSFEDIMISYDFQAGVYVKNYFKHKDDEVWKKYYDEITQVIEKYLNHLDHVVLFEAGCGEATTLVSVCEKLNSKKIKSIYGLDASFSRLMVAKQFSKIKEINVNLIMGDMMNMPICDGACDIVFTVHACEPNGGNEEKILKELLRITNAYLILFEPAYDLANEEARRRMEKYGYITKLYDVMCEMGCEIVEHRLLGVNLNNNNPTGITVIRQNKKKTYESMILADPISKTPVVQFDDALWSEESMLLFPRISDISCMCEGNAIVATKYGKYKDTNI